MNHQLLDEILGSNYSENTKGSYRGQWHTFKRWLESQGYSDELPIDSDTVIEYLLDRYESGKGSTTLRQATSAITYYHHKEEMDSPCKSIKLRKVLRGLKRRLKDGPQQATPLIAEDMRAIEQTACKTRSWGLGRMESEDRARSRGLVDIALIRTMRDAQLRRSEAAMLLWDDIEPLKGGGANLSIPHSKTDQNGDGAVQYLTPPTFKALKRIKRLRPRSSGAQDFVFDLSAQQINRRITKAAAAAGLKGSYTGHSPRVGMTVDLARTDIGSDAIQQSGRWQDPKMVALYTRGIRPEQGAVARWYELEQQKETRRETA